MTDRLETHVLVVNNVTTVQLEVLTVVPTGLQLIQENLLPVARLVPVVTLLVHLVLLVAMTERLEMIVLLVVNGHQSVQLVTIVLLVESGLLKDLSAMIVLLVVMTEHLVESGLQNVQHVMIVPHVVNGHQSVQHAMTELLAESGQMTVVQEIHVDQIVLLEMTTVREVLMVQEISHLTRRLSLKMLFLRSFSQLMLQKQLSQLSGKRWDYTHAF